MSQQQPTPGPWTADLTDHPETGAPTWCVDGQDFGLALVDGPQDAPNEANARLMASAPTLRAERDGLLAAAEFAYKAILDDDIDLSEVVAVLEQAIEEARGLKEEES